MIHSLRMSTRWWTFGVWAAVAASALHWGFKLLVAAPSLPREVPSTETGSGAAQGDLSRLLGAETTPADVEAPVADARFQLIGVISSGTDAQVGLALIAVDGKPAKAFRVGAVVEGQNVLQAVGVRSATLGPRGGAALLDLSLPPPAPPATGMLPVSGMTPHSGSTALAPGGKPRILPLPVTGTAHSMQGQAAAERSTFQTQQQLFHQRQQMQFQEEEMQNQGDPHGHPCGREPMPTAERACSPN